MQCHWCEVDDRAQVLLPLGPGGRPVCVKCVTDPAHPEREEGAAAAYEQFQRERADAERLALAVEERARRDDNGVRLEFVGGELRVHRA